MNLSICLNAFQTKKKKKECVVHFIFVPISAASVMQMLHLNDSNVAAAGKLRSGEPVWKILVYDRVGQEILSPILSVQSIRQAGVTLNM